jgi:hypothetical protein
LWIDLRSSEQSESSISQEVLKSHFNSISDCERVSTFIDSCYLRTEGLKRDCILKGIREDTIKTQEEKMTLFPWVNQPRICIIIDSRVVSGCAIFLIEIYIGYLIIEEYMEHLEEYIGTDRQLIHEERILVV